MLFFLMKLVSVSVFYSSYADNMSNVPFFAEKNRDLAHSF